MTVGDDDGPLVSVIVIFLDAEAFLDEAIASVLRQTWGNWELLLVDDGSTDASAAIARRHCAEHPGRVRYLHHEGLVNRGMSASRNLGLREAAGELVAFSLEDPEGVNGSISILHHRTNAESTYHAEIHGVMDPSGTRLLYSTSWGSQQSIIASFVAELNLP